ncbi:hypothetical protein V8C42DRAFT_321593 [Trichoderma barbatum]
MELPRWSSQLLVFCLIPLVQAYTTFSTNCSTPDTMFNYVSSPNTRGTLDILWSSLFTIIACTWSLQHPNVPEQRNGRDPGWWGNIKWSLYGFYRSTLRMFWTVIAPELIILTSYNERKQALKDHENMQDFASKDGIAWSLSHSYYANMGGFVIRSTPPRGNEYHDPYHLNSRGIYRLRKQHHIKLPKITTEEIQDKSKGDTFVKMIALGQIVWSVVQIIVRATKRLVVTPLEVAVVAFAVCAVIMYGLYWEKPQRVGVTQTIQLSESFPWENGAIAKGVLKELETAQRISRLFGRSRLPGAPISFDNTKRGTGDAAVAGMIGASLFGGIHVVAWNFAFPTNVELIFWRCASIYTAAAPLGILLISQLISSIDDAFEKGEESKYFPTWIMDFAGTVMLISFLFVLFLYVIARLFIIVEMFRTLCFLPPGSYVSTWTSNIPHFA